MSIKNSILPLESALPAMVPVMKSAAQSFIVVVGENRYFSNFSTYYKNGGLVVVVG